ncbi:hypothetical protein [Kribbella sp. NPDC051770]|uniref:hypothetical protein n=1 Tax=Kribbella sp. NPDC051770 TaxID=3155413 RepID=UPI003437E96A
MKSTAVILTGLVLVTATACGTNLSSPSSHAAEQFYRALAAGDGAAACELLAPQTREEVEDSAEAPCRTAILDEDIPAAGAVTGLHQYGDQAQVRLSGDTAFLAEFGNGWKVVAAACTPRGERPYDCKVEG